MLSRIPLSRLSAWLLFALLSTAHASPAYLAKRDPVITYDSAGHITNVTDPTTQQVILQGPATDGSGNGFDVPAIVWLAWAFAVGVPLMLAGIRLGRLTTGAAIGCAGALCIWAAFVNALTANGIADLWLMVLPLGAFACGFVLGLFEFGRIAGIAVLGVLGGLSVGVRVVLFRPGLLVPHPYWPNWVVACALAAATFLLVIIRQRAAIAICSAAVGSFLTGLGVDLVINRQAGMSMGLRYLFDRNSAHIVYMHERGWHPPIATEVIMAVSLAVIPLLAYAQHRVFAQPFKRARRASVGSRASLEDEEATIADRPSAGEKAPLNPAKDDPDAPPPPTPTVVLDEPPLSPKEDTPFTVPALPSKAS